jgi:hypothetical protein
MSTRHLFSTHVLWDFLLALTLLGGIALVGGCDMIGLSENDPRGDLRYIIEAEQLAPGDSTTLRLHNGGSSKIGYNLTCSWAKQRTTEGWRDARIRRADACLLYLRALEPGETATTQVHVDSSATEGVYRFSTDVEIDDKMQPVVTRTFRIEATGS